MHRSLPRAAARTGIALLAIACSSTVDPTPATFRSLAEHRTDRHAPGQRHDPKVLCRQSGERPGGVGQRRGWDIRGHDRRRQDLAVSDRAWRRDAAVPRCAWGE